MTAGERVYEALSNSPEIRVLVEDRIEPGRLPEASALPAIVYRLGGGNTSGTLAGFGGVSFVSIAIDVYYRTIREAEDLHRMIRDVLAEDLDATASIPEETYDPIDPRFRLTADYTVAHDSHDEEA